ncbi:MAG: hypothetical protein PHU21_13640 [Elusimicrobia bacterium]|nr:hypothetical protein [Elusimicrobiota bacterium]
MSRRSFWLAALAALVCGIAHAMEGWVLSVTVLFFLAAGWGLAVACVRAWRRRSTWLAAVLLVLALPFVILDLVIMGMGLAMALCLLIIAFLDAAAFYAALAIALIATQRLLEKSRGRWRAVAAALALLTAAASMPWSLGRLHRDLERFDDKSRIEGWRFRWNGPEGDAPSRGIPPSPRHTVFGGG